MPPKSKGTLKQKKHRAGVATRLDQIQKQLLSISKQLVTISIKLDHLPPYEELPDTFTKSQRKAYK